MRRRLTQPGFVLAHAPYCIAEVLAKASEGRLDESFAFAGSNAWRCEEIVSVKRLIQTILQEYENADTGA
jgi:hypothetical protein